MLAGRSDIWPQMVLELCSARPAHRSAACHGQRYAVERAIAHCEGRAFLVEMNTNGFMPGDDVLYKMQKVRTYVRE